MVTLGVGDAVVPPFPMPPTVVLPARYPVMVELYDTSSYDRKLVHGGDKRRDWEDIHEYVNVYSSRFCRIRASRGRSCS